MKKVAEVLDGLREEERRLSVELSGVRRAIAALEEVLGIVPAEAVEEEEEDAEEAAPPSPGSGEPAPPPGPYATWGFYDAAADYLAAAGEPKSALEIAAALQAGGYPTRATNFRATVRTMLNRRLSTMPYGICATDDGGRWFVRR
jgi:hypothetical protein